MVYDIGLDNRTLKILKQHKISIKKVPTFCTHWRKHFTWKIWCINDAPAQDLLWIDAGIVVLRPMDEIFETLDKQGYLITSTDHPLVENASEASCRGCNVEQDFRQGKTTLNGCFMAFKKEGIILEILQEALRVAKTEEYIKSTKTTHRHDQALISLLMYRYLRTPKIVKKNLYSIWESPRFKLDQKTWVHRRSLRKHDLNHFVSHISRLGNPYLPKKSRSLRSIIPFYLVRRWLSSKHEGFIYDGVRN